MLVSAQVNAMFHNSIMFSVCLCESGKPTQHKSRFQEEFPELAAGVDDKTQKKEADDGKELQYGPGPSLRPQSQWA